MQSTYIITIQHRQDANPGFVANLRKRLIRELNDPPKLKCIDVRLLAGDPNPPPAIEATPPDSAAQENRDTP